MKKLFISLMNIIICVNVFSQLTIDTTKSALQLAQLFAGSGIQITNATFSGSMANVGIAAFNNGQTTNLGLLSGVVISTGRAIDIPQSYTSFSGFNNSLLGSDSLLNNLAGGYNTYNTGYLEFDFIPATDSIELSFIFASEEYTEYVCSQFSDAVGIFLSGEYPTGTNFTNKNIALVPGTNMPVNINTINTGAVGAYGNPSNCVSLNYSSLYVNNISPYIVFNGFTVPLKAKAAVIANKTYHMRIAIADVGDGFYDSGVFLDAHSFKSTSSNTSSSLCANSQSLCFSSSQTFSLLVNTQAETGPDYGCLYSHPNPSWFNIHVSQPGNLVFNLSPTNNNDIDFICWGPFDDAYAPCTALLTSNKIVDCSYSPSSQEVIDINNAEINAYYIFMVTNYTNTPTSVVITQSNAGQSGAGSITCQPIPLCNIDSVTLAVGSCDSLNRYSINGIVYSTNTPASGFLKVTDLSSNIVQYFPTVVSGGIHFNMFVPFSSGSASLKFEFSEGICSKIINYQRPKIPTVTSNIGNSSCGQSNGYIITGVTANGIPNYSYHWSTGLTVNNTSSTTSFLQNISAGHYSVSVYNANNCYSVYSYNITNVGAPNITVSEDSSNYCSGSCNAVLRATAISSNYPLTYCWSSGMNYIDSTGSGSIISNLCNGTYYVTVTDVNSCASVAEYSINASSNIQASVSNIHYPSCSNSNNGYIQLIASGGVGSYSYLWSTSPAQTSNLATYLSPGAYSYTVSDAMGCSISNTIELPFVSDMVVSAQLQEPRCGNDGQIQLTTSGGVAPYYYIWNTNPNNHSNILSGLNSGSYSVSIVDALGCEQLMQYSLYHHATPLSSTIVSTSNNCIGQSNGMAIISITGGTPPYFDGQHMFNSTDTINHLLSGSYTYVVTDSLGCSVPVSFSIQQLSIPSLTAYISNSSCGQMNGSVLLLLNNGTAPYTYSWSNGLVVSNTTNTNCMNGNLSAGVYAVTVVNGNGCLVDSFFVVNNQSTIMASIDSIIQPSCPNVSDGCVYIHAEYGTAPYTYNWSNGCTSNYSCNLGKGNYFVTITDASNCNAILVVNMPQGQIPVSDFTYNQYQNTFQFNNLSSSGNYLWMFGDGVISTEINPTHTYQVNGYYTVCLTLYSCDTITNCKIINVIGSNINDNEDFGVMIAPNPASYYFEMKSSYSNLISVELYNSLMQKVLEKQFRENDLLNISQLAEGVYFVKFKMGSEVKMVRLIIAR